MGKLELVHLLLAAGADPALANESGETPLSVGASDEIKDAIRSFDPVETGRLVEEFATRAAARKAEARAAATAEESKLEDALGAAERADGVAQRELKAARAELARLIEEHDLLQTEGKGERTAEITLQVRQGTNSEFGPDHIRPRRMCWMLDLTLQFSIEMLRNPAS